MKWFLVGGTMAEGTTRHGCAETQLGMPASLLVSGALARLWVNLWWLALSGLDHIHDRLLGLIDMCIVLKWFKSSIPSVCVNY